MTTWEINFASRQRMLFKGYNSTWSVQVVMVVIIAGVVMYWTLTRCQLLCKALRDDFSLNTIHNSRSQVPNWGSVLELLTITFQIEEKNKWLLRCIEQSGNLGRKASSQVQRDDQWAPGKSLSGFHGSRWRHKGKDRKNQVTTLRVCTRSRIFRKSGCDTDCKWSRSLVLKNRV